MKKINPKEKKDKDADHIQVSLSKKQVAIHLRKGEEVEQRIYMTRAEFDAVIDEYNLIK